MKLLLGLGLGLGLLVGGVALTRSPAPVASQGELCSGDCGKLHQPCSGSVICCKGLTCISRSGGDPTCEER